MLAVLGKEVHHQLSSCPWGGGEGQEMSPDTNDIRCCIWPGTVQCGAAQSAESWAEKTKINAIPEVRPG
jgi:hypothetical protein